VVLDIRREGEPLRLVAAVREQPRVFPGAQLDPRLTGATFAELPEGLRQSGISGVVVESIARGSRAARNDLRVGDVVVASSAGEFDDLSGFRAGFTQAPAQLILRIVRGNRQGILTMQ